MWLCVCGRRVLAILIVHAPPHSNPLLTKYIHLTTHTGTHHHITMAEPPPPSAAAPACIGILALQGAFEEHRKIVEELGARTVEVN